MATNCIAILVAKYRIAGMTRKERGDDSRKNGGMSNSCLHLVNYSCIMDVFFEKVLPFRRKFYILMMLGSQQVRGPALVDCI